MPSFPMMLRRSPKRAGDAKSGETTEDEGSRSGSPKSPRSPMALDSQKGFGDTEKKSRVVSTRELLYEIRSRLVGKPPPSPLNMGSPQRGRAASQPSQPQRGNGVSIGTVRQPSGP